MARVMHILDRFLADDELVMEGASTAMWFVALVTVLVLAGVTQ